MSDIVWQALIAAAVTIILAYLQMYTARRAAVKVEEVKEVLASAESATAAKLTEIVDMGVSNHTLLNSSMATALRVGMIALRRVAELTRHPDDVAAAELAEKSYHEHEAKQARVDAAAKKV